MSGVNEYDTTPGNNSTINSVNVAEGCAPSGINNALRQLMADIKDVEGVQTKTGAYTIVKADYGNLMEFTTAATATMTAVATLGDNWYCYIWANGVDVVVDGDGSETINGSTTLDLPSGSWARIWSDGTELHALVSFGDRAPKSTNRLINSEFMVDIEGNAGGATASNSHIVEGWTISFSNDVTTQTGSRVAIDSDDIHYALKYAVTTGSDSSIAAGQYGALWTAIEGYDVADALWGTANAKPIWITGKVKAPTTGTYCLALRNASTNRSYVTEVACTADTWVDFEKEVPGDTSGTWEATTGKAFDLFFTVAGGTDFHASAADAWEAGNFFATSNQANGLATNANEFLIANVTVGVDRPAPFVHVPYSEELARCSRYYTEEFNSVYGQMYASNLLGQWFYPVEMRATPTISGASSLAGTLSSEGTTVRAYYRYNTGATSGAFVNMTADARLI